MSGALGATYPERMAGTAVDAPPLRWWSQAWRYAAAVFLSLMAVGVVLETTPSYAANVHGLAPVDLLLGLLSLVLVGFRRRWPVAVALLLTLASAVAMSVAGPWALATVSLATHRRWGPMLTLAAATMVAEQVIATLYPDPTGPPWQGMLIGLLGTSVLLAVGAYTGARRELLASLRERAATAEREQSARVAQARTAERAAIAREMHDVLAHRISLLAMHAGALAYREDLTAEQTRATAETIQATAHAALSDLRGVLGVLRSGTALNPTGLPERPQPTLADLDDLVGELRAAGALVEIVDARPTDVDPPTPVARHAYRILQECCTNARKHAPGSPITITLAGRPGAELLLEVSNPAPPHAAPIVPGARLGLIGLAERAELVGGRLEHDHTRDDRFRVRAALPWPIEETP